jgi:uncharacterized damage-inducible protein DinB
MSGAQNALAPFITREAMLRHWQGHRALTRRVIEAFPEDQLHAFSIGGMRSFGQLAMEMLSMAAPMLRGLVDGEWEWSGPEDRKQLSRAEILEAWDHGTAELERYWQRIPAERFLETETAFGQFTDRVHGLILYVVDNEIHHRAQGYVYLRALGVEPPPFWERA